MSFYAVARGRGGAAIYHTWEECRRVVSGYSGALFKKFNIESEAREFIGQEPVAPLRETDEERGETIDIFIDGACKNNGMSTARAAYACHFPKYPQYNKSMKLSGPKQTNNRAEYSALILAHRQAALLFADLPHLVERKLEIYTDSELLYKTVTLWLDGWKDRDWKRADKAPVANIDLLLQIDMLNISYNLHHVRAHTGGTDYFSVNNAIADSMAANL